MKLYISGIELNANTVLSYRAPDLGVTFLQRARDSEVYWGVRYAPLADVVGYYDTVEDAVEAAKAAGAIAGHTIENYNA